MKPSKVGTTASEEQESLGVIAMAAEQGSPLHFKPMRLKRRAPGPNDVVFDLTYSGVCHTDVHIAADHFKRYKNTNYPCVPGHELFGVVTAIGANVSKFAVGDLIGVGCFVDSCLNCSRDWSRLVATGSTESTGSTGSTDRLTGKPPQSSPVTASMIGSIQETQEIIDLCDKHKIFPEIIVRPVDDLNRIFEDLDRGNDKGVRYVLDIKGSLTEARAFGAGAVQAGTIKSKQEATEGQK
eukprot:g2569.t1